jgi:pimeloyl-ACP methyl ester carboxylesterase
MDIKTELRHRRIATNGIELHLVEAGDPSGPPILLLHGFPEFWYGWHRQIDYLVERGYRLLIPDQRGYNLSDKPRGVSSYRIDTLTDDAVGLLDAEGIDRAYIIAHDWGGAVAWNLALRYPDRVRKLVNLNIPHPRVMVRFIKRDKQQRKMSWYIYFFQLPWLPERSLRKDDFKKLRLTLLKTSNRGTFSEEEIEQYVKAWSQPGALTAMLNWYRAAFRWMFQEGPPPEVQAPTLLIWGKADRALSHAMAAPSIDYCQNGELVYIQNATHWVQHDAAAEVNRLIGEFLPDPR